MIQKLSDRWRSILAALPLPMLALAASYGVFSFALLFVPVWVAIVQAASFELTYIGLAVLRVQGDQRTRARYISIGAVAVSIVYNSLAGLFHRLPDALRGLPLWAEAIMAVLHGLPLALVAYLVADLLLHQDAEPVAHARRGIVHALQPAEVWPRESYPEPVLLGSDAPEPADQPADTPSDRSEPSRSFFCRRCNTGPFSFAELGRHSRTCKE